MSFATKSEKKNAEFVFKSLVSGGVAGMCSKTAVAPLDRIKILLQAHSQHYKHLGVFAGLKEIVQREAFFALYKGNGAQMVRIFPYAATQFTAFEIYKKYLGGLLGSRTQLDKFLAGSGAGVTAVTLTYPLDTIRARLAFQVTGEHVYTGIAHTAASIFKQEGGIKALYRGFMPTICGMVPYAGLSFYSFEKFKFFCMKYAPNYLCNKCNRNTGGLVLTLPAKLLCGGFAGAVAQSVSYPLDVTRRRMQLAMMNPATHKFGSGMVATMKLIYLENGIIKGLYRGMSINYLRAVPMVAVSFATYELMKQLLDLDTGMKL
ncbi:solute carrier family 25 member 16 isoform X1 [Neodiprion pinetum]|uniref:Graves disease carrier protein isoform X1 n=1 Tax=Neodiprion lecontei TaxID=441921 RepID=A0A6J0B699_NEOLC|nr:graves disease carrier protein isoform X1 [Neodiprion lecontei]XP_046418220.1 graves disease carrier protein-like isoform X1 [Neodiprion fabricii]XP_046473505.1 graves disease carrier protein-like isoform X1 [Neodiprion pinetum]XP_046613025.1 graves disease carrier protein-like isoform X1 [Neodiprion virginianus]